MPKIRVKPTEEQLADAYKYRLELRKRFLSTKFVSYMLGYSYSYINAILNGVDPLTPETRVGFNYIIDIADSLKKEKK